MNPAHITIAALDRNAADLRTLTTALEDEGYRVLPATTEAQVERFAGDGPLNLVVKGFDAGHVDVFAFLNRVRRISPDTEFVLCGKGGTIATAVDAIHQGACDYLAKPVAPAALVKAVRKALERQALVAEDPKLRQSLKRRADPDLFVGTSRQMRSVVETLTEIAPTNVPVLISGESGTGKEIAARTIHDKSGRRAQPFIAINCAGLADNLIESELFGHVRGAFTGAVNDRPGAFQLAYGGTLFLDEIGDLCVKGQGDLLRVLEDAMFRPVGSPRPVRADVRIIAATNRILGAMADEGRFREDLLYRLNIVELSLPPLRARTEDIPALVNSFNAHFSARHTRRKKVFSGEFLTQLARHPWPGNVRQLRNLIERLVVTVRATDIGPEHAPPVPTTAVAKATTSLFTVEPGSSIADVEFRLIRETLARVTSNRRKAAEILGISPRALAYKLKLLHITTGQPAAAAAERRVADGISGQTAPMAVLASLAPIARN